MRTSSTNASGCSKAAKWPPRSSSFQCRMSVKRLAAHRREGRGFSLGKIEHPAGTVTTSVVAPAKRRWTCLKLSQYNRAADAPVPGSQ